MAEQRSLSAQPVTAILTYVHRIEHALLHSLEPHLRNDVEKLRQNRVPVPYLLHLSRMDVTQAATEQVLCAPEGALRTACVHVEPASGARRFEHVGDSTVSTAGSAV